MRRCVALALLVLGSLTIVWSRDSTYQLGPFVFLGPPGLQKQGSGTLQGSDFSVSLLGREPDWVTHTTRIEVSGHGGTAAETRVVAPVAGGDPRATDVRDHGLMVWFPVLGAGLHVSWRTYGGLYYWWADKRMTQRAQAAVTGLVIER